MGCTYVDDFDFGPSKTHVRGYARGGPVKKEPGCGCGGPVKKAKGGPVVASDTGTRFPSKEAYAKHEAKETPAMKRSERMTGKEALPNDVPKAGMPLPKRRGVPVAPKGPLIVIALGKGKPGK